jgi:hypothetical protein
MRSKFATHLADGPCNLRGYAAPEMEWAIGRGHGKIRGSNSKYTDYSKSAVAMPEN